MGGRCVSQFIPAFPMKILKKIPALMLAMMTCAFTLHANAQFSNGEVLTAPALNAALAAPTITGGTITNAPISGSSGSFTTLTASGAVTLPAGSISLSELATQAANTVLANVTGATASPTAFTMPSCSTASSALNYTLGSGWSCNTAINASSLGGNAASAYAPIASPALTGTPTAPTAAAGTNTTQLATTAYALNAVTGGNNAGSFTTLSATGTATLAGVTATSMTNSGLTAKSFVYSGVGGLMSSTAAPTNGQLLIGSTGNAPVAATLTCTSNQVSCTNGAGSITVGLPSTLAVPGTVTSYNGTTTAAGGVPILVADVTEPNLTANLGSTTIYTVPSGKSGWYEIRCNAKLMTAAGTSSTLPSHTITGTDADNSGSISGNAGAPSSANNTSAWSQGTLTMYLAASSAIAATTTGYASNPANAMVYQARYLVFYDGP